MLYRFCGSETVVGRADTDGGEVKLIKFGQKVEFTDALARDVILGGGFILPADAPAWTAFTEQELSIYADQRTHADAKPAFLTKKRAVQRAVLDLRAQLEAARLKESELIAKPPVDNAPAPAPVPDAAPEPEAPAAPAPETNV